VGSPGPEVEAAQRVEALRRAGIEIRPGLTAEELAAIETRHAFRFPPDLRALLAAGLPTGDRFPDWRGAASAIEALLGAPVAGLLYDVEHNALWLADWGPRPADADQARLLAAAALAKAPMLAPVWAHRYLPTEPAEAGNPVLSVHQSDIVVYGVDLADYLSREFGAVTERATQTPVRAAPFWSQLVG